MNQEMLSEIRELKIRTVELQARLDAIERNSSQDIEINRVGRLGNYYRIKIGNSIQDLTRSELRKLRAAADANLYEL